jgi:hypothetical protein
MIRISTTWASCSSMQIQQAFVDPGNAKSLALEYNWSPDEAT